MHKCSKCHKEFKRKIYLKYHIEKNICDKYNQLPFGCDFCDKRYSLKKTLAQHVKNKHSSDNSKPQPKKVKCPMCNKTFSRSDNMKRHQNKGYCPMIKNGKNVSITNNNTNNIDNSVNDNSVNDNSVNIQNNITINFGKEKLDDWINEVGRSTIDKCLRDINAIPTNLLEAKHVLAKKNRNVYIPSDEHKYKDSYVYLNGWIEMKTSLMLTKMLIGVADDIYDIISNNFKYGLRLSKKLKEALDEKITAIQNDKFLQGPAANMLLKHKEALEKHFNESR
jgi:uncharacterized C2H2 Zn-finger protein